MSSPNSTAVPAVHTAPAFLGALSFLANGITATLEFNGVAREINPKTGEVSHGQELKNLAIIRVQIPFDTISTKVGVFVALPDQNGVKCHCSPLEPSRKTDVGNVFERRIKLQWSNQNRCSYTRTPENTIRLVEVSFNTIWVWEISLVYQEGVPYFAAQRTWRTEIYRDGESIVIPRLSSWHTLEQFLGQFVDVASLPPVTEYVAEPDDSKLELNLNTDQLSPELQEKLKGNMAYVTHFAVSSGTGAAIGSDGTEIKLHHSEIMRGSRRGLEFVLPGEVITYMSSKSAPANSKFAFEAGTIRLANNDQREFVIDAVKAARTAFATKKADEKAEAVLAE